MNENVFARFVKIDFLPAELQRLTAGAKGDDIHTEDTDIEIAGRFDIPHRKHHVIDPVNFHCTSLNLSYQAGGHSSPCKVSRISE